MSVRFTLAAAVVIAVTISGPFLLTPCAPRVTVCINCILLKYLQSFYVDCSHRLCGSLGAKPDARSGPCGVQTAYTLCRCVTLAC